MNSIEKILKKNIKNFGSISLKDFLNIVLYHDQYGYYSNNNIIGKKGDFITSPEISQVFGEIVSNPLLLNYTNYSKNKKLSLIELGPGRGYLTKDVLRTFKNLNEELYNKIKKVYFLERSSLFFKELEAVFNQVLITNDPGKIPDNFNILLANEFFDALPVSQYIFKKKQWHEVLITLNSKDDFIFCLSKKSLINNYFFPVNPPEGFIFEYSEYMINLLSIICKKISLYGGIFIIVDYAKNNNDLGSSLAALKNHKKVDFFYDLGNCDISHKPSFELIKKVCLNYNCNSLPKLGV